ncbi:DNA-directed RNA polymerase subunit alpha C-terminal domain-containing protein [Caballeronia sp. ATUFL_F1_KS39]|uniref:DNA-directed RNA polymerase subunit alpha C-terminal domain-containing protein n=1 Tax=Caballeronia sp. ATUFL_F1_KS39 TaxID=2921766 RepID=UPI0020293FC8|nr:DNA-directed RNA polymerase subunit alpha C-terminal domain-containing protein [Caballeronia sp. ATUFL_F1_KS39]
MDDDESETRPFPTRAALNLPRRICNALDRDGLRTVDALTKVDRAYLRALPGLGPGAIVDIEFALADFGLTLKGGRLPISKRRRKS